jgi:hypothetical protein
MAVLLRGANLFAYRSSSATRCDLTLHMCEDRVAWQSERKSFEKCLTNANTLAQVGGTLGS